MLQSAWNFLWFYLDFPWIFPRMTLAVKCLAADMGFTLGVRQAHLQNFLSGSRQCLISCCGVGLSSRRVGCNPLGNFFGSAWIYFGIFLSGCWLPSVWQLTWVTLGVRQAHLWNLLSGSKRRLILCKSVGLSNWNDASIRLEFSLVLLGFSLEFSSQDPGCQVSGS